MIHLPPKRVMRFVVVGITNAMINFGVLNLAFYVLHQPKIISSIISTTCALIFSFILNRGFVFVDKTKRMHRQLPAFVIVTVIGSILILNTVYIISLAILNGHNLFIIDTVKTLTGLSLSRNFVDINLSTVFGAIVAMVWNYNGYKWFVFRESSKNVVEEIEQSA